ncbi:uncharacterized protein MYCFIDRAFT_85418 [Pseudocercospora fijiensis CIRAD86]|uniref:J domain-containing protein n=1 Tax=Pseudocercospora fijiensis (strain CIRAD86) TaxID=383855 RepID=M2YZW7_PSEFD|nr:uncharacterized protein MYCFIDRAFT_85418 [Pseudocercospora fijiensis CIRAD86]EME83160.1 hypothetical protein MYCFIDRAFT_85418 [Pseudocercospora fijiensis CIRAD86]
MDHIAKLKSELEQAKQADDKARVSRLVRMIGMEERKARMKASREEDAQRKARESFLPSSKSDTPRSRGPVAAKLPPMAYFNDFEDEVKREEEARQAAERVRKEQEAREAAERARQEEARRKAEERRQREQDQQRQRDSKFRDQERQREREQKKKSYRSTPANTPARASPPAPAVTMPQIKDWYAFAETCNRAREKVQTFPVPPGGCCGSLACVSRAKDRANKACECNIRRCFRNAGIANFKKEMLKWHPDKWSRSPEAKRDDFQKLAREIFVVLKDM